MVFVNDYGVIYKITNQINNKCYIGQTYDRNIWKLRGHLRRLNQHKMSSKRKYRRCPYLENAMRKHGVENFTSKVLLYCPMN